MEQDAQKPNTLRYCLYVRKSSEQSERQALSIDSQISEMQAVAKRDGLMVVGIHRESHSAKESGQRTIYNQMLREVGSGKFNAILTWAPDRLSRNAGDLGSVVDLMDQGKLVEVKTPSQRFTNHPNEKFLLMILCSQAKLENDNKSVNVKRGLKTKVEMGYRPNMAPLGYLHDKYAPKGERRIFIDPERGPLIQEAFRKVAFEYCTGRDLKQWFDEQSFTTRKGKKITLSMIYRMMDNSFYTGRYEFPCGTGNWYDGKHEPLIKQEIFDRVQGNIKGGPRNLKVETEFAFTKMFRCGTCGCGISAQEKRKRLKDGTIKRYVYYGCNQKWITGCKEPYMREENLYEQMIRIIDKVEIDELKTIDKVRQELDRLQTMVKGFGGDLLIEQMEQTVSKLDARACAKWILKEGNREEKRNILYSLTSSLIIRERSIYIDTT